METEVEKYRAEAEQLRLEVREQAARLAAAEAEARRVKSLAGGAASVSAQADELEALLGREVARGLELEKQLAEAKEAKVLGILGGNGVGEKKRKGFCQGRNCSCVQMGIAIGKLRSKGPCMCVGGEPGGNKGRLSKSCCHWFCRCRCPAG